jgi:hypothetical protein
MANLSEVGCGGRRKMVVRLPIYLSMWWCSHLNLREMLMVLNLLSRDKYQDYVKLIHWK